MDTTARTAEPAGMTDTPPPWSESIARRLVAATDAVDGERTDVAETIEGTDVDGTEVGSETGIEAGSGERGDRSGAEPPTLARPWLLLAPLAGAVVLSAVSVAVDPNPLRTGASPAGLLAFAILIPFFCLCLAGTLALVRDGRRLRAAGFDRSPSPWRYVVPSAGALAALHALRVARNSGGIESGVGLLVGSFVVALAASSILAGPAYLLARRRRRGPDRAAADARGDGGDASARAVDAEADAR